MAKRGRRPGRRAEDKLVSQLQAEESSLGARLERIKAAIRALVGGRPEGGRRPRGGRKSTNGRRRRKMSAEARKRISEAQRKRWAEHRAKAGAGGRRR